MCCILNENVSCHVLTVFNRVNRRGARDWDGRKVISATYEHVFTGLSVAIVCGVIRTQWIGRSIVPGRTIVSKRRFDVPRRKCEFGACVFYCTQPDRKSLNSICEHTKRNEKLSRVPSTRCVRASSKAAITICVVLNDFFKKSPSLIFVE